MSERKKTGIGEWIRFTDHFWSKPKVRAIAAQLSRADAGLFANNAMNNSANNSHEILWRHVTCSAFAQMCMSVNRHAVAVPDTKDALLADVEGLAYLDEVAKLKGMGEAMSAVGWAVYDAAARTLHFPNYLEYNDLIKARALGDGRAGRPGDADSPAAKRMRARREQSVNNTANNGENNAHPAARTISPDRDEEQKQKQTPTPSSVSVLEQLQGRCRAIRPEWRERHRWTPVEEHGLLAVAGEMEHMDDLGWRKLAWFFKHAATRPEDCGGGVTASLATFLEKFHDYRARAEATWKACGSPRLLPAAPKAPAPAKQEQEPPESEEARAQRVKEWGDLKQELRAPGR